MLTEAELRGLIALHGELTVSVLAGRLDHSLNYTSELVDRLEATGLVETSRVGKSKLVRPSDAKALELLMNLVHQYSHIDWPDLLGGAALRVLYYLDTPRTAAELATRAGVHRSTVYRTVEPLQHRGIVYRTDTGAYALNNGFEQLSDLSHELAHHIHRQRVEQHTDTYTILWESLDEFLVQTPTDLGADSFIQTGPALFEAYDLPLLGRDRKYYLYSNSTSELSPELLCCHMLVIDSGTRFQSYCLLLLRHVAIDREELRKQADQYGVEVPIENLLTYLDTKGDHRSPTLPDWASFQALAEEYGVSV